MTQDRLSRLSQRPPTEGSPFSEEQYRSVVDATTDAVVSVNEKGQILFVNPATTNTFVYDSFELIGQAQADLAHINQVSTMGWLTASLAHEIKQPISAAIANAEACLEWLARDRPDIAEAQEAASRIIRDVTRASNIITRIGATYATSRAVCSP